MKNLNTLLFLALIGSFVPTPQLKSAPENLDESLDHHIAKILPIWQDLSTWRIEENYNFNDHSLQEKAQAFLKAYQEEKQELLSTYNDIIEIGKMIRATNSKLTPSLQEKFQKLAEGALAWASMLRDKKGIFFPSLTTINELRSLANLPPFDAFPYSFADQGG